MQMYHTGQQVRCSILHRRTLLNIMAHLIGSIKDEVIKIFKQTFGIDPKGRCRSYKRPYPEEYEHVAYPQGFKIPEFAKFTGNDSRTTLEHIGQFIIQCGEASTSDIYKLRLFPLSLSGAAFTWFISLPPNSVFHFY